jgi:hypothetical protein
VTKARAPYPATLGMRFSNRWLASLAEDAADLPTERLGAAPAESGAPRLEDRTQGEAGRGRSVRRPDARVVPQGLQLVGPERSEHTLLSIAAHPESLDGATTSR